MFQSLLIHLHPRLKLPSLPALVTPPSLILSDMAARLPLRAFGRHTDDKRPNKTAALNNIKAALKSNKQNVGEEEEAQGRSFWQSLRLTF
jgi:hypothetical protein